MHTVTLIDIGVVTKMGYTRVVRRRVSARVGFNGSAAADQLSVENPIYASLLGHTDRLRLMTTKLKPTREVDYLELQYTARMSDKDPPRRDGGDDEGRTGIVTRTRPKTKKPSLYKVLLLNDDYTPMEFVVLILQRFFAKGQEEATRIMLHVHHKGVGICGVYTYEVAETKVTQVMDFSRQHGHPLQCTMEKE